MGCGRRTRETVRRQASMGLLVILLLVSGITGAFGAFAVAVTSDPVRIDEDTTLTADLYGCVEIVADNIVFDLNGYSIIGPGVKELPRGIDLTDRTCARYLKLIVRS